MTNKDAVAFSQIMAVINETFGDPSKQVSELKMEFYFQALQDMSIEELNDAAIRLANTKVIHTFPTPAEIREAARGTSEARAEIAFESLMTSIRSIGPYRSVIFEDGITAAVVEAMGGWDKVNDWYEKDREWNRKEFLRIYKVHELRGTDRRPVKMAGIHETDNALKGFEYQEEPLRIGDKNNVLALSKQKKIAGG